jgi:hypothetical protein
MQAFVKYKLLQMQAMASTWQLPACMWSGLADGCIPCNCLHKH